MANVLAVHFLHCHHEIIRVFERDKAIAFGFLCALVFDYFGFLQRRILDKRTQKHIVIDFIAQITTKDTIVVYRKVLLSYTFLTH